MKGFNPFQSGEDHSTPVGKKSLTKQAPAEETEISAMMERYAATGALPAFNRREPRYGDFTGPQELQEALQIVIEGREMFDALPAKIRAYVNNDPVQFLELVHDPGRLDELRALGLVPPGEAAPPATAQERQAELDAEKGRPEGPVVPEGEAEE